MRKSMMVGIGIGVVMVLYFARVWARTADAQGRQAPAMIALVQQQFELSSKLLAMHPSGDDVWIATANPVDCKFQRPQIKNCWEVYFGTNVEGPDQNGRKPGKVEVNFIVDGDAMRLLGGAQPGGMLVRKGRSPDESAGGDAGEGQRGGKLGRPDRSE